MDEVTRIWLAAPEGQPLTGLLPPGLAPAVTLEAPVFEATGPGGGLQQVRTWLQAVAAAHAGHQVVLVGDARLIGVLAGLVLGIPAGLVRAASVTLDWPTGEGPPQLIGVDLDWIPPFLPGGRARFPGGPGVAGTARA